MGLLISIKQGWLQRGITRKKVLTLRKKISPLAKLNTIILVISLATKNHWKIHQLDVKYYFLNGDLKEEV